MWEGYLDVSHMFGKILGLKHSGEKYIDLELNRNRQTLY